MKISALCVAQAFISQNAVSAVTNIEGVDNKEIFAQEFSTSNLEKHSHSNLRSEKLNELLSTGVGTDYKSKKRKKMDEESYVSFYTDYSLEQLRKQEEKVDIPYKLTRDQIEEKIRTIYHSVSDSDGKDSHAKGDLFDVLDYAHKHIKKTPRSLDALALETFKKMFKESGVKDKNMNDGQIHEITKHCLEFYADWLSLKQKPDELCPSIEKMFPLKYKTFPNKVKSSHDLMCTYMVENLIPISGETECQKFMEEVQVKVEIIHGNEAAFPDVVNLPGFKNTYEILCKETESQDVCSKRLEKITSLSKKLISQRDIKKYPAYIASMCDVLGFDLPHPDETIELRARAGISTTPKVGVKNTRHLVSDLFLLSQHHKHRYDDKFGTYMKTNATASEKFIPFLHPTIQLPHMIACEGKAESVSGGASADLFVSGVGAAYEWGYGYEPEKPDKCKSCDDESRSDFKHCNGRCTTKGYATNDGSELCADLSDDDDVCKDNDSREGELDSKDGHFYYDSVHTGGVCARGPFLGLPGAGVGISFGTGYYDKVSNLPGYLRTAYLGLSAYIFSVDFSVFFCCSDYLTWSAELAGLSSCEHCGWAFEIGLQLKSNPEAEIGSLYCYSWSFDPDNTMTIPYNWDRCRAKTLAVTVQLKKVPSSVKTTFEYKKDTNMKVWKPLSYDENILNDEDELILYVKEPFITDLKICLTPNGSSQNLLMAEVGMVRIEESGTWYDEDLVLWEENIPYFRVESSDQKFCCRFNFFNKDGPSFCYIETSNGYNYRTSWWTSFDKKGWSDVSEGYMTGIWKNSGSGGINLIEEVSSSTRARGESLNENDKHCKIANWSSSFDQKGSSICEAGYFITGLYRTGGNNLFNIEQARCCRNTNFHEKWGSCYDEKPVLNKMGWSSCNEDYFIAGFHRKSCGDDVSCLDKFHCCKMVPKRSMIVTGWWTSFDKKGWSDVSEGYMTGIWKNSGSGGLYLIEQVSSSTLYQDYSLNENDKHCKKANWWSSFDQKGSSRCEDGYFITGLYRTGGNNLFNIEQARCCRNKNFHEKWGSCYDEDPVLNEMGWSSCNVDHFITGFHRESCEVVGCIDKFHCCKMVPIE